MNALEIAQEFEDYLKEIEELPWGNHQILCDQAAEMLRQQQAEILAGKIMIKGYSKTIDEQQAEIEALKAHPAKELTDEEMYELLEKYQGIELCKAVLRKASEK